MARRFAEQAAQYLLARFAAAHGLNPAEIRAGLNLPQLMAFLSIEQRDVERIAHDGREFIGELDPIHRLMRVSRAFPHMRTFTIAHEIGHFELHPNRTSFRDAPSQLLGPQPGRPDEEDANRFATALLMPEQAVRSAFFARFDKPFMRYALTEEHVHCLRHGHHRSVSREEAETQSLRNLAQMVATCGSVNHDPLYREFGVSKESMAIQLEGLELVRDGTRQRRILVPIFVANAGPSGRSLKSAVAIPPPVATSSGEMAVVLIGELPWHAKNRILLKRHGWTAIDDDSADAVAKLRPNPPCGVVVHSSFWKHLSSAQRKETFRKLIELSTYIFVRVDISAATELAGTAFIELPGALLEERAVGAFRQTEGNLDETDLFALKRVFDFRQKTNTIQFELDAPLEDVSLLKSIAVEKFGTTGEQQVVVAAKLLREGNSGARGYSVSRESSEPLFVKVGEHRALAAELERGKKFQKYLSDVVIPELRFHGPAAALVQPLVSARGNSPEPAPSLHEFLNDLTAERARFFLDSILPCILGVLQTIGGQRTNDDPTRHLVANLSIYNSYLQDGLTWIPESMSRSSIDALARWALKTLTEYNVAAIVHGDGHLRNILLRNGVEPVFVDFANAGSGHPLLDLVRLEVGIWTAALKQADPRVAAALVRELLTKEAIASETVVAFRGDSLAVEMVFQSAMKLRDACRAVTHGDPCWFEQYRAMHALLAMLALRRPEDHYLSLTVFAAVAQALDRFEDQSFDANTASGEQRVCSACFSEE
jgi:hypothetical protein